MPQLNDEPDEEAFEEHLAPPKVDVPNPYSKLTLHDMMEMMKRGLVEDLLDRLESKTATHQELAIIQRMLNDSGYAVVRDPMEPSHGPMLEGQVNRPKLPAPLPSYEGENYDE